MITAVKKTFFKLSFPDNAHVVIFNALAWINYFPINFVNKSLITCGNELLASETWWWKPLRVFTTSFGLLIRYSLYAVRILLVISGPLGIILSYSRLLVADARQESGL